MKSIGTAVLGITLAATMLLAQAQTTQSQPGAQTDRSVQTAPAHPDQPATQRPIDQADRPAGQADRQAGQADRPESQAAPSTQAQPHQSPTQAQPGQSTTRSQSSATSTTTSQADRTSAAPASAESRTWTGTIVNATCPQASNLPNS